jgi:Fic family protein
MLVLSQLLKSLGSIPTTTAWYLTDLSEARGKQELFTRQAPQRLRSLREHAIIESAVSSNRIEGVEIEGKRIGTVIFGRRLLKDRDEEEVRGYRNALKRIHARDLRLKITEKNIRELHRLSRGEIWDAGKYKEKDSDIIEHTSDGRSRVRFVTVPARETSKTMRELIQTWNESIKARELQPLIALAAFNLDFLCVHPFRDGNGRVSRLLLLLQCYHLGFEVGRYISLERIIEENKERYYEALEHGSKGWHEGKSDPWPFVNFVLSVLRLAYKEFESRVGKDKPKRGEKRELIADAIENMTGSFRVADLQRACPGVGLDHIRKTLGRMRKEKKIKCLGRGQSATWVKI